MAKSERDSRKEMFLCSVAISWGEGAKGRYIHVHIRIRTYIHACIIQCSNIVYVYVHVHTVTYTMYYGMYSA